MIWPSKVTELTTHHGGCLELKVSKWVLNKWMYSFDNYEKIHAFWGKGFHALSQLFHIICKHTTHLIFCSYFIIRINIRHCLCRFKNHPISKELLSLAIFRCTKVRKMYNKASRVYKLTQTKMYSKTASKLKLKKWYIFQKITHRSTK